ncbi:HAD family hydrolase [Nitratidesulfovibrio sp. 1201_IL3209]|uniref:HAD family hydrolase n=1 Tax=Nitratidesulfovibrio sp. 1201_IL3209 TaxID=3084053 RepID=UPI002FDA2991
MSAPGSLRCAGVAVRAVVFDFDGTLAAPTLDFGVMRRAVAEAMRRHLEPSQRPNLPNLPSLPDLPVMDLPAMEWIGHVTALLELHGRRADAAALHADAHAAIRRVEVEAAARGSLFPFTRPMLAGLAAMGVPVAIVTRNCPEAVRAVFPDVDALCPCLLTRDDVPSVKPDPDHLLRALGMLGRAPGEALMVGDHPMDIVTGHRAGTLTAGVASGESPARALHDAGAHVVAADCGELMAGLGLAGTGLTGIGLAGAEPDGQE